MPRGYGKERTNVHNLHYHCIWCPKYRKKVLTVDEAYTSQHCNRCAEKGKRPSQGLFMCPSCGLEDNADKNGALNIAKRALGKFERPLSSAGAVLAQPITPAPVTGELPPVVGTTPCGGTPRLQSWE